jgi:putative tryptophan/tyrosine transport system substrate-binding protein
MMRRRNLSVGLAVLGIHRLGLGQGGGAPRRVGVLLTSSVASGAALIGALKRGMDELGWKEGSNVEYRIAYANGDFGRFDALAADLVAQHVEVIVVGTSQATRAAHKAAPSLPIVMASVANAVEQGFIASLARPGGSITGQTMLYEELRAKLIQVLHEMLPGVRRVAVLQSADTDITALAWVDFQRACLALGLEPQRFVANDPTQIAPAVERIVAQRAQAVVVPSDGMLFAERVRLQALLDAARLPSAYQFREHVAAGGLFGYGSEINDGFRRSAKYVDKILKGARPAVLPVEQPTKFELVINLNTAKALGITVPPSLLLRADEVIE